MKLTVAERERFKESVKAIAQFAGAAALALMIAGSVGFYAGLRRCDCSLPATTGAGQGALDRG